MNVRSYPMGKQQSQRLLTALAVACATGCSAAGEREQTEPGESETLAPTAGQQQPAEFNGELLLSLKMSPTHVVKFWEMPDGRFGVSESGHLDLDRGQPSYAEMPEGPLRLAAVYEHLVREAARPHELALLRKVDRQVEAIEAAQSEVEQSSDGPMLPPPVDAPDEASPEPDEALVEKGHFPTNSCNIAEFPPGWSWPIDGSNFEGDWCGPDTRHCRTNMSVTTSEWWRTTNFKALGFAQDFCNRGRLRVWDWVQNPTFPCGTGAISSGVINDIAIEPRHYVTVGWTNNGGTGCFDTKFWYYAQASKHSGPHGSRVGLIVNPQPCQPFVNCPAHQPQGCASNPELSCHSGADCSGALVCLAGCCGTLQ